MDRGNTTIVTILVVTVVVLAVLWFSAGTRENFAPALFNTFGHKRRWRKDRKEGQRIVFSLTTSPKRIEHIRPVIESIKNQLIKVDKIYLHLPKVFKRNGTKFEKIPEWVFDDDLIHVNFTEDIGPATKILPVVDFEKNPETIVVSIDDDSVYHRRFLNIYLWYLDRYPDAVLTGSSLQFHRTLNRNVANETDFLEGFSGVMYKIKHISDIDRSMFGKMSKECYLSDDLILSNEIVKRGFKIIVLPLNFGFKLNTQLDYGFKDDALHKDEKTFEKDSDRRKTEDVNEHKYRTCARQLEEKHDLHLKGLLRET